MRKMSPFSVFLLFSVSLFVLQVLASAPTCPAAATCSVPQGVVNCNFTGSVCGFPSTFAAFDAAIGKVLSSWPASCTAAARDVWCAFYFPPCGPSRTVQQLCFQHCLADINTCFPTVPSVANTTCTTFATFGLGQIIPVALPNNTVCYN